jgi:phage shock protein C
MTSPYPPYQPPRKLERSRSNRMLGGVCGGVANYVNMDPTLVRILAVVITVLTSGAPIIAYLIALFVMPEEDKTTPGPEAYPPVTGPQWNYGAYQPGWEGQTPSQPSYAPSPSPQASPTAGSRSTTPAEPEVWGAAGAPWEQSADGAADRSQPTLDDLGREPEPPHRDPKAPQS